MTLQDAKSLICFPSQLSHTCYSCPCCQYRCSENGIVWKFSAAGNQEQARDCLGRRQVHRLLDFQLKRSGRVCLEWATLRKKRRIGRAINESRVSEEYIKNWRRFTLLSEQTGTFETRSQLSALCDGEDIHLHVKLASPSGSCDDSVEQLDTSFAKMDHATVVQLSAIAGTFRSSIFDILSVQCRRTF